MKKVLYGVLAAFLMGVTFTGCTSKKDVDQLNKELEEMKADLENLDLDDEDSEDAGDAATLTETTGTGKAAVAVEAISEMVKLFKATHISSEADIVALKEKIEQLEKKYPDDVFDDIDEKDISGDEAMVMLSVSMELATEAERLEKEAKAIGVELGDLMGD